MPETIPCPVDPDDEIRRNGFFEFNITKMTAYIRANREAFPVEAISADELLTAFSVINQDHVDSLPNHRLQDPVILAEIAPDRFNLIDGSHRVERARQLGIPVLPAYRLNSEQHIQFLISTEAIHAYRQYWQEKLRENRSRTRRR